MNIAINEQQIDIFNIMYPTFKITKPIRLIELFGGYGSQHLALKYLGVEVEHWKLVEWAVKSIQAYKDLHYNEIKIDYSKDLTKEKMVDYLFNLGISSNYNEPMTYDQIKRLKEEQLRNIYNNIKITKNLVNIQNVKGKDLEIIDTDKYDYIMTYSFPCQDLSLAGKRAGMSDNSTRSGMLWEVERILSECKKIGQLPQVLLMENVPQVHSTDNLQDFNKWQLRLEELGYKNYWQDLIATDYGIPQTRNRTFMVSILGDYNYDFPQPKPLKLKLKDLLEEEVEDKYYLSDKMIKCFTDMTDRNGFVRGERFNPINPEINDKAYTVTTGAGNRPTDNFIIDNLTKDTENYIEWKEKGKLDIDCRAFKEDKVMSTIMTTPKNKVVLKIPEATKQGYAIAHDGDGVYINRPHQKRGCVQKDKIQTLKTSVDDIGVVVKDNLKSKLCNDLIEKGIAKENDVIKHSYTGQIMDGNKKCIEMNNLMPTMTTRPDCLGVTVKDNSNLRIRKLTPKECFRLMGVKDEDYERIAVNQSNSSLYHLAGDSIVVNVLMAIFKELLNDCNKS